MGGANEKALNPPKGACRQCWFHAYDRAAHKGLKWNEPCPVCLTHLGGCPKSGIVR
ncbi:pRL2-8 [Streptomyces sp. NPDC087300]|uniref:pRL2-8 n=1 Tax=Streptomyces sp. NPDC087300 TaxID=3365780 RepID=UPI0038297EAC